jgi:sugar phosphate isomerase/epimerase
MVTAPARRDFLRSCAQAGVAILAAGNLARAEGVPERKLGLQLYTVRTELARDFDRTLEAIRAIGFEEVEMAGFFDKSARQLGASLRNAGLRCASVHFPERMDPLDAMDTAREIGAKYVVTALYLLKPTDDDAAYFRLVKNLRLDDYKSMADQCNTLGERARSRGLVLAYHNENMEFKPLSGGTGYDELLRLTEPNLVKLELDCGWVAAAGRSPAEYLSRYGDRYRLLHVKDFKPTVPASYGDSAATVPVPTELGRGHMRYQPILEAAGKARIEYYYVEQEAPFKDMTVLEALKVDYRYMRRLT